MLSGQPQTSLFLLQKDFVHTKTQIKPKQTNKIKLSKQKQQRQKLLKEKKNWFEVVVITLFTILLSQKSY